MNERAKGWRAGLDRTGKQRPRQQPPAACADLLYLQCVSVCCFVSTSVVLDHVRLFSCKATSGAQQRTAVARAAGGTGRRDGGSTKSSVPVSRGVQSSLITTSHCCAKAAPNTAATADATGLNFIRAMEDLEDSVASLAAPAVEGEEVVQPRKLGRLRRAGAKAAEENAQPNAAEPASPARPAAREKDRLDEGEADRRPSSPTASAELQAEGDDGAAAAAAAAGEAASPSQASSCGAAGSLYHCNLASAMSQPLSSVVPLLQHQEEEGEGEGYYDEEDELEQRYVRRATQATGAAVAASAEASEGAPGSTWQTPQAAVCAFCSSARAADSNADCCCACRRGGG